MRLTGDAAHISEGAARGGLTTLFWRGLSRSWARLDEAEHAVRGTGELRGVLRVGISSFAIREIAPRLPSFMKKHPALRVEVLADDLSQNFVDEGIDVGLRFGSLPDSTAVARRIAAWPRVIVASPAYLKRSGVPQTPANLAAHSVIVGPSRLGPA
jgi:DNA-binding transcriptional LysR family regulator